MLITQDDYGVITGFNFHTESWVPILDLKDKFPSTYKQIWIVGFLEHQLSYIELQKGHEQPPHQLRGKSKLLPFKVPMLEAEVIGEKKEQTLQDLEEQVFRETFILDHEQYRKDVWEPLKMFRGESDKERFLSDSILEAKAIVQKKKDLDAHILNQIRLCIMNDEH